MDSAIITTLLTYLVLGAIILTPLIIFLKLKDSYKNQKSREYDEFNKKLRTDENGNILCPFCGSTQIQVVKEKYNLLQGFSTNKNERVCLRCMKKF